MDVEAGNITDGMVFLNRDMPAGYDEAIENQGMLRALDAMDFWSAARLVAEPEGVEPESNLPPLKAPLVYAALEAQFPNVQPGPESYAGSTHALVEAYLENDLDAMKAAWQHFEPLTTWASGMMVQTGLLSVRTGPSCFGEHIPKSLCGGSAWCWLD